MTPETDRAPDGRQSSAAARTAEFEATQRSAERAGLPRYEAWSAALERRYTVMPLWYWDTAKRRAAYTGHIRASLEWQRSQARMNSANRRFFEKLCGPGEP